ncbi:hypothetical protein GCM10010121_024310 [Streptomyces brasiliensis]|uniref:Integrase n=1 Tax=Streptomyces brasiliensis TaxID=1954 RepID=A0A917KK80_9ACTN|nr:hypothetical protein GCM10010121_024310 [Streptomyces brasiliensis]
MPSTRTSGSGAPVTSRACTVKAAVTVDQMRLGHAKPSITLNVYTHLWEAEDDRTADMMEAALSDVPCEGRQTPNPLFRGLVLHPVRGCRPFRAVPQMAPWVLTGPTWKRPEQIFQGAGTRTALYEAGG